MFAVVNTKSGMVGGCKIVKQLHKQKIKTKKLKVAIKTEVCKGPPEYIGLSCYLAKLTDYRSVFPAYSILLRSCRQLVFQHGVVEIDLENNQRNQ